MITYVILFVLIACFQKPSNVLGCGLIGYCGSKPADPWKLRMLFLYNLKRGSDATGIFIDNVIYKEASPASKFLADHFDQFENTPTKNFVVIGHDRNTSSGGKAAELAHPHGVKENDTYKLVLAHNGTIHNMTALCQKYEVDHAYQGKSDSSMLTEIMAKSEKLEDAFPVLSEYGGTATLLFTDPRRKNVLFVHRDPERELFMYQEEGGIYISSIRESLEAIGGTDDTVFEFEKFNLYKIVKGKLINKQSTEPRNVLAYKVATKPATIWPNQSRNTDYYQREDVAVPNMNGFCYRSGKYFHNGHLYTGSIWFNREKNVYSEELQVGPDWNQYYFVGGLLAKNKESFTHLFAFGRDLDGKFNISKFNKAELYDVDKAAHTLYPLISKASVTNGVLYFADEESHMKYARFHNGKLKDYVFTPFMSNETITLADCGVQVAIIKTDGPLPKKYEPVVGLSLSNALVKALEEGHDTLGSVYASVRKHMGGPSDSIQLHDEFLAEFIKSAVGDGIVEGKTMEDADLNCCEGHMFLDELVKLYKKFFEDLKTNDEFGQEKVLSELAKSNKLYTAELRNDIEQGVYDSIDDLLADYAPTDNPKDTEPLLEAIVLILNALGIISNEDTTAALNLRVGEKLSELAKYYDILKECCKVSDKEAITVEAGETLSQIREIEAISEDKITNEQRQKLGSLKCRLKNLMENPANLDVELLSKKYDTTIDLLKEAYV